MRMTVRNARGQATVELALGLLVFVTVLIFGIHFAEVGYLSTRVQQAAAFAVYDATGQRAHENGNDLALSSSIPGLTTEQTRRYFRDFDANRGDDHDRRAVTQVFTSIDGLQAQCRLEQSITYTPLNPGGPATPSPYDGTRGGIACGVSATIRLAPGFPRTFFDDNWNLRGEHYSGPDAYTVCATARSRDGRCGRFGLLLGDFSLQGARESRSHDLFRRTNPVYARLVEQAYGPGGCPAAQTASLMIAGAVSTDACAFQFSYQGVERNYQQDLRATHAGSTTWNTGGTNSRRAVRHPQTFLGVTRF